MTVCVCTRAVCDCTAAVCDYIEAVCGCMEACDCTPCGGWGGWGADLPLASARSPVIRGAGSYGVGHGTQLVPTEFPVRQARVLPSGA